MSGVEGWDFGSVDLGPKVGPYSPFLGFGFPYMPPVYAKKTLASSDSGA